MISLPTSRADWRLLGRTVRLVLGQPGYLALATVVGLLAAVGMSLTQNLQFNVDILVYGDLTIRQKLAVIRVQLPFFGESFEHDRGLLIYSIAALTGTNLAMLSYHVLEHDLSVEGGSGSAAGVMLGTIGAGCAACGPGILAGVVGIVGGAGVLATLPYEGLEFSLLAVLVLVLSMYWLAEGMRGGQIRGCPVDPGHDSGGID